MTPRPNVRVGSWLCENAKTPEGDRRSYSSKTVLALKLAGVLNSENELKNVILAVFRFFAFLHSQGQTRKSSWPAPTSALPPKADSSRTSGRVRFVPKADIIIAGNKLPGVTAHSF
jgi:hypothetical protein